LHVMCARKLSREAEEGRSDIDEKIRMADVPDQAASRMLRMELPWRDWVIRDLLRYWYALLVLAADAFLVLTLLYTFNIRDILGIMALLILVAALVALEVRIYRWIWPGGIFFKEQ